MYSYYFLAALGPSVQKYLWWKKYLTRIQIVRKNVHVIRKYSCNMRLFVFIFQIQFAIAIAYCAGLYAFDCTYPKLFILYMSVDVLLFLYMFLKFYRNTYGEQTKKMQWIQTTANIQRFVHMSWRILPSTTQCWSNIENNNLFFFFIYINIDRRLHRIWYVVIIQILKHILLK